MSSRVNASRSLTFLLLVFAVFGLTGITIPRISASSQPADVLLKVWGGPRDDFAWGAASDLQGNVYVSGQTTSFIAENRSAFLLKYNTNLGLLWQRTWGGASVDTGVRVAVDSTGNIYLTGITQSFGDPNGEVFIAKFNSSGGMLWQRVWGGGGYSYNYAEDVATDHNGNIYVTGYTDATGAGRSDVLLLKFDSTGELVWQKTWGGPGLDSGDGIAIDNSGNIYVTGWEGSPGVGARDAILLRSNSTGSITQQEAWGGSGDQLGRSAAVDSSGNVYIAGMTNRSGAGGYDALLLKYNSTGGLVLAKTWGGSQNEVGYGVVVDSSGNIYLDGYTESFGGGGSNQFLLKIDATGTLIRTIVWNTTSGPSGMGIAADSTGNVFAVGGVGEAPPYAFISGNSTLGNPASMQPQPSFPALTPSIQARIPAGTVEIPSGNENYGGGSDASILELKAPPKLVIAPGGVIIASVFCSLILALRRWGVSKLGHLHRYPQASRRSA